MRTMTLHRLALTVGLTGLFGAFAVGQEPPKALPGQPKEMPTGKDKDKDKPKDTTQPKDPVGGTPEEEPPPPPIRPKIPGDIVDRVFVGSYVHGTSTVHGGVAYEGPFPNGLYRTPNFHFGGFYAPAPFWPALALPDYYYPGFGIHSQYYGFTPYTFGLWNTNPIPSPLAGGAVYPDITTLKPGQMIPVPGTETGPRGPMPPPGGAAPPPKEPGMGRVPGQPVPTAPGGPVQAIPAVRRR
jgi:hypothetical protein